VHEIPLPQRALLALDDQQRFSGKHEEILLVGFPVVHRHRLTGLERDEVDPDLLKLLLALDVRVGTSSLSRAPARITGIQDEPAVAFGTEPMLGRFELRLGDHRVAYP
jgi:hypothetical protein